MNKQTSRGFTLLELLVVVLIIGILAAIALLQYQKVVEKSRWMQVVMMMRSVKREVTLAYLEGSLTEEDKLDVCKNFESLQGGYWSEGTYYMKDFYIELNACNSTDSMFDLYRTNSRANIEFHFHPQEEDFFACYVSSAITRYVCDELHRLWPTQTVIYE